MSTGWRFAAALLLVATPAAAPLAAEPAGEAPAAAADAMPHKADGDSLLFSSQALGPGSAGRQSSPRGDRLSRAR